MKLRLKEVSDWIKKKGVIPTLKPNYGDRFIAWWMNMQSTWHTNDSETGFSPSCDVLIDEPWLQPIQSHFTLIMQKLPCLYPFESDKADVGRLP